MLHVIRYTVDVELAFVDLCSDESGNQILRFRLIRIRAMCIKCYQMLHEEQPIPYKVVYNVSLQ